MVGIIIECTGMLIDNFATQDNSVELDILLINCDGRLSLNSHPSKPRSKHEFILSDASDIGYSGKYNLDKEQSSEIFLLACTLLKPRNFLSCYQPDRLSSRLIFDQPAHSNQQNGMRASNSEKILVDLNVACHVSATVSTHLTSQFVIDGYRLFWIIENLLRYRIFDANNRTLTELNVIDAIKLYRDSLSATDPRSCYLSMYAAFEKIITSEKKRTGDEFDRFATYFTGMNQSKISHLRELENRLKHSYRNTVSDVAILKKFEENPRYELAQLKSVTDPAILSIICHHFQY
jgi:hypothetical protein